MAAAQAPSGALPAWWRDFPALAQLETGFVQESDSAVFGKLRRQGQLRLARGGRLRVEYRPGSLLVADGRSLIQYDPQARTAQKVTLRSAALDTPLLNVLVNPGALAGFYRAKSGEGDTVILEPLRPTLPRVVLGGGGGMLRRIQWTDPTGASQQIEFQDPHSPARPFDPSIFTFQPPPGTRWIAAH
jgi:outer membrane lipoprotein-sorting protein